MLYGNDTAISTGRGIAAAVPTPREPGPLDRTREMLGYLRDLEQVQREMRLKLFGPWPEEPQSPEKRTDEPCLDEMLANACQRAALAVGESKSLLNRL